MLTDAELEQLLIAMESDRVERKASVAEKDRVCEAICAFANDLPNHQQPGVVFVGVHDDGSCANLAIDDRLLQTLAAIRSDGNILPLPEILVQKRRLAGCDVAVVEVQPSVSPPVRYKGRVWIRVGPRRAIATRDEERRLSERRKALDRPFDHQTVQGASLSDLDTDLFGRVYLPAALPPDVLAHNDRSVESQLASLHFVGTDLVPNVAGILVLGKDPTSWIPGAYVQFVRFDGRELTDPIRHQESLSGALPDLLADVDRLLATQISSPTDVEATGPEQRIPDYPVAALTQVVRNAVMHRNYDGTSAPVRVYWFSDRVEVHSPGGPFGQVTVENFGQPGITDYRNPLVAEAMKTLGYVQRFGIGLPLARKELERNGNPPLELQVEGTAILATVRSGR